jgi:hypothetical protein
MIIIIISFNVVVLTFVLPVKPDRLFCIVTEYELTDPGFDSGQGKNFFLFSDTSNPALGPTLHTENCLRGTKAAWAWS